MSRLSRVVVITLGAALLAGCGASPPARGPDDGERLTPTTAALATSEDVHTVLRLDFDGGNPLTAKPAGAFTVSEQPVSDGAIERVQSFHGGRAIRFPRFEPQADAPGVVLVVSAAEGTSSMPNPGTADFSFGTDVLFDSFDSSAQNNGGNILQRGLSADEDQFKLQVDRGLPSCVVAGTDGRVAARGDHLAEHTWYRLRCDRVGESLRLIVDNLAGGAPLVTAVTGEIGSVQFADTVPIAIARKLTDAGVPVINQPDQFNGTLDNVWIGIAD